MIRKSRTLSVLQTSGVKAILARKGTSKLVLGLSALALAAVAALRVMPAVEPSVSPGTANLERSVAASSARWNGLAAHYTPNYDAATAANSARYQALARYYGAKLERSTATSSARWNALAAHYGAGSVDHERSAAAATARWNALAAHYGAGSLDNERSTAASAARYQALAEWFARKASRGK